MRAWHFVKDDRTLRDGRSLVIGEKLVHDGPVIPCESGYHASERLIDALHYAPGAVLCRVECGGEIIHDGDKLVARERTALWSIDATEILRSFARQCALDVAHLWNMPAVVRGYLENGDESKRAAAWDAARAAAWAAARDAAWAAAWAAAGDAARAAAWAAARDAARAAAWAAARDAAGDAAGDAARDAAWAAQNDRLTAAVLAVMPEEWR